MDILLSYSLYKKGIDMILEGYEECQGWPYSFNIYIIERQVHASGSDGQ